MKILLAECRPLDFTFMTIPWLLSSMGTYRRPIRLFTRQPKISSPPNQPHSGPHAPSPKINCHNVAMSSILRVEILGTGSLPGTWRIFVESKNEKQSEPNPAEITDINSGYRLALRP